MSQKEYKTHAEIPAKYKWDLSFLLEGKKIEDLIDEIAKQFEYQLKIKDSKYESKKKYLDYLKKNDELTAIYFKVHNYLSNSITLNVVDPIMNAHQQNFQFKVYQIQQQIGAEQPRFNKHIKEIKEWIKDDAFEPWRRSIQSTIDSKKYQLPKAVQEYRVVAGRGDISAQSAFSILTNSELDYGYATTTSGKKIKVTKANRTKLAKHKDAKVRKTSITSFRNAFLRHKGTLTNLLFQHFKALTVEAKTKKFDSTIHMLTYSDRATDEFLQTLYKKVEDNMHLFRKADKLQKKFYKNKFGKAMTKFDHSVELVKPKSEYTPEMAMKLVSDAFKPFGKEYHSVVKNAFKSQWVDFFPLPSKRGGAYSIGASYGLDKKLIMMNFAGDFNSVTTLAHEMGHSMHSYFSDESNPISQSQYPIFVAEIASIFNELMVFDHVLQNSDDDKLKFAIRSQMAQGFEGTVLRQTLWSKYEYDFYKAVENGVSLATYPELAKFYYESVKPYAIDPKAKYKEENQFAAFYVPHFYAGFYVYKYAIGQLVANIFFAKYKKEGKAALQEYIDSFLKAGAREFPLDTLKAAGIDLSDASAYDLGFKSYEDNLKELEILGNKLFKKKK